MPYYFLKRYKVDGTAPLAFTLVEEKLLMAGSAGLAIEQADHCVRLAAFNPPDETIFVLCDYEGKIIWDRGP